MTPIRSLIAGTAAAALLATPLAATAQGQSPSLPQELSGLGLSDVRDSGPGDDREIRATLDGTLFEVEYDDNRLEEIVATSDATLPQALLDAMLPAEVLSRAGEMGMSDIVEVEFDDDGEIEMVGMDSDGPVEATFSGAGRMMSFERRDEAHRGPPDHAIRHDMTAEDVRRIASEAGYDNVEWIEIRPNHVEFDAVNPNGETVEVRLDDDGRIDREERR